MLDYKAFAEFKLLEADAGGFEGYASLFGVLDSGGDVVEAGAFKATLPTFLHDGFISLGHDWNGLAIGTVAEAHEDSRGLFIRTEYHSTPVAQDARRTAQERMDRGKSVGLSIGYLPQPGAQRMDDDGARHLLGLDLFEVAQVNVPMLRPAAMTGVKGLPYREQTDCMLADLTAWIERTKSLADLLRTDFKEGRAISSARRVRLAEQSTALRAQVSGRALEVAGAIDALLEETAPQPKSLDLDRLRFDHDRQMAAIRRTYGVPA